MSRKSSLTITHTIFAAFALLLLSVSVAHMAHHHYFHRYDHIIIRISSTYGLDPALIHAVIYQESRFNPSARSQAGAVGLMQVTPSAVKEWKRVTGEKHLGKAFRELLKGMSEQELTEAKDEDVLLHPEINIALGCWYIDHLMKRYSYWSEPLPIILASYNAGPSNANRWQDRAPVRPPLLTTSQYIDQIDFPETRNYVLSVMQRYRSYKQQQSLQPRGWVME